MLDLYEELRSVVGLFSKPWGPYALCGGLAMAVHSFPRATVDIDLLVLSQDIDKALETAAELGYAIQANPMYFSDGQVEIRRVSKADPEGEDLLCLDLLVVTPRMEEAWRTREEYEWEGNVIFVVSREGLIDLKLMRKSGVDLDDIESLRRDENA